MMLSHLKMESCTCSVVPLVGDLGFAALLQYGALRRKIGGTYKDFFKSYIDGNKICAIFLTTHPVVI